MNAAECDTLIRARIADFVGYLYRGEGQNPVVEAPAPLCVPRVIVRSRGGARVTDCSTFAGVGVVGSLPGKWSAGSASALAIGNGDRPWSNVEAAIAAGVGVEVAEPVVDRWHFVQHWSGLEKTATGERFVTGARGHSILWRGGPSNAPDAGTIVHASSSSMRVLAEDRRWSEQVKRYTRSRVILLGA